jgi:hypothetical protein
MTVRPRLYTGRVKLFLRQPTMGAPDGAKIISISNQVSRLITRAAHCASLWGGAGYSTDVRSSNQDAFRPTWCNRSFDAAIIEEECRSFREYVSGCPISLQGLE